MSGTRTLRLVNPQATPRSVDIVVDEASVPLICQWYAGFHAGDSFKAFLDGERLPLDQNGEPL